MIIKNAEINEENVFNHRKYYFLHKIPLTTNIQKILKKYYLCGALLTDLMKAFDFLNNEHLVAKLNLYGFTLPALKLVHDYFSDRKLRTRVNNSYS